MKTVHVSVPSSEYDVRIGSGALDLLGETVRNKTKARRCVVVSGKNVFPLYGERTADILRSAGLETACFVYPGGEEAKTLHNYGELLNFLTQAHMTRTDCLVALGGGVTGDLTGFAAATYQRGVPFVQLPTTLLAAVDSSVGGKTAINLPAGKNQAGAFHQPTEVLCDTDLFKTLPERELRAGFAEVIKYAVIGDADLFDLLMRQFDLEEIIKICVEMKAEIVAEDELDYGRRRLLNLGHSFGHAIEACSNYTILHGEAVAIGLAMMCRAAVRRGFCDYASCDAVIQLLKDYSLPTETDIPPQDLYRVALLDKKFASGNMHLIVPKSIGWCVVQEVPTDELLGWITDGMESKA